MSRYLDHDHSLFDLVTTPASEVDQKGAQAAWDNMPKSQHSIVSDTHKFWCMDVQDADPDDADLEGFDVNVLDRNTDPDDESAHTLGSFTLLRNSDQFQVTQVVSRRVRLLTTEAINAFLAEMAASKPEPKKALSPVMQAIADQISSTFNK